MHAADLFAGLGGSSTGASAAGATVVWAANHWDVAIDWHARNHPETRHYCQDLAEVQWHTVDPVDWLHASPACQGFSQCGQPARRGTGGNRRPQPGRAQAKAQRDRNTAWAVLAAADTLRPETITVENVVDFQTWAAFGPWCDALRAFGYQLHVHTVNGAQWGGAQDRPRTLVTARLGAVPLVLDVPNVAPRTIGECLDSDDDPANRWRPIASKSERMRWRIAKAQREAGSRCFWANVSESRGRALSEPFPTSTTKSGTQWCLVDGDRIRVLNPREMARSMGFPESYQIPRQRAVASALIGNAMDVRLMRGIAEQVAA